MKIYTYMVDLLTLRREVAEYSRVAGENKDGNDVLLRKYRN